jgi:rhamnosyltransferase
MYPQVAVLLTTYNGHELLGAQLASIQSQQKVSCSIFVSDDISTDNTLELLNSYSKQYGTIELLENHQKSRSPAHNFFSLVERVNLDKFDYILYSDQDDVWLPDKISSAIEKITADNADCYASNLYIWADDGKPLRILRKDLPQTMVDYLFQSASAGCTYCISQAAAIVLKKTLAEKLSLSPEKISHDWITYAVTRSNGFKWVIDSSPQIMYRQHASNVYGASAGIKGLLSKTKLVKQGWYMENLQYVASICRKDDDNQKFIEAITRLTFLDRLFLLKNFYSLRRKKIEGFVLGLSILIGSI